MKKNRSNIKTKRYNYDKHEATFGEMKVTDFGNPLYYGLHMDGGRAKVDIKRMRKVKRLNIPDDVYAAASAIPRHTTYFLPKKLHRADYVCNQFYDTLQRLKYQWAEYKEAFKAVQSPEDVAENVRLEQLAVGYFDNEEATVNGMLAGFKRTNTYNMLWVSQCSQFILQIATELDALLLRKCRQLGFSEKDVSRGKLHTFLHGTVHGRYQVEKLKNYDIYNKFFTINNMLKHNSEDLFEKVKTSYSDMLLTTEYKNGEMSQYYLKIGGEFIESMLNELNAFYEELCEKFLDEDVTQARWNYDDYFISKVNKAIEDITNPLGA